LPDSSQLLAPPRGTTGAAPGWQRGPVVWQMPQAARGRRRADRAAAHRGQFCWKHLDSLKNIA